MYLYKTEKALFIMSKKSLIILISLLSCGLITMCFFLFRQNAALENSKQQRQDMLRKMDELIETSNEAVVVRRASEQLEQIAYQQKDISDIQRQEAIRQREESDVQKEIALRETEKANIARAEAVEAFDQMEEQKKIADQKREEAEESQRKTDSLARMALGRSLASQAVNMHNAGNDELSRLMVYSGVQFLLDNGGDVYQSAVYDALNEISASSIEYPGHNGYIRDIAVIDGDTELLSFISVSSLGEVFLWTRHGKDISYRQLMKNDKYDFRSVIYVPETKMIIAISYNGEGVSFSGKRFGQIQTFTCGVDKVLSLDLSAGSFFITSRDEISSWIPDSNEVSVCYKAKSQITASFFASEGIYVAEKNGKVQQMDSSGNVLFSENVGSENYATCITTADGKMAFGLYNGEVIFYDANGVSERLLGHISPVNSILWSDKGLVTASNDGTVRFWNYDDHSAGSLLIYKSSSWIYSAVLVDNGTMVVSGGASTSLHSNVIVPYKMADEIKAALTREYTESEWNYYIGEVAPYRRFMK